MNQCERTVAERLEAEGWTVICDGWPDLLCVKGELIKAVEVKRDTRDILKPNQSVNHAILRAAGLAVEVAHARTQLAHRVKVHQFSKSLYRQLKAEAIRRGIRTTDFIIETIREGAQREDKNGKH